MNDNKSFDISDIKSTINRLLYLRLKHPKLVEKIIIKASKNHRLIEPLLEYINLLSKSFDTCDLILNSIEDQIWPSMYEFSTRAKIKIVPVTFQEYEENGRKMLFPRNILQNIALEYGLADHCIERYLEKFYSPERGEFTFDDGLLGHAMFHAGIAKGLEHGMGIYNNAANRGTQLGIAKQKITHAQNAARSKNKKARDWVCEQFMNVLQNPDKFSEYLYRAKFSRNKFAKLYLKQVNKNKEFNIKTTEKTIKKWVNDYIKENPEKLAPYKHLIT